MAIRLSTLQVKYLRYWEPLVVPGAMVAAWWLARLQKRYRRIAVTVVAAGTILWGVGFVWAFIDPHPHRTAAQWLSTMIEAEQIVAYEHWDETLDLKPESGPVERIDLPSYDLRDDAEKSLRWCRQLARADWVVLTSNRVRRTVLANPERFPLTGRLYRLLLAGEAGFTPVARVNRGPRLFGLFSPVQTADESFVNYDFPRVLIFRRTSEVSPEELTERVQRPLPFSGRPGLPSSRKPFRRSPAVHPGGSDRGSSNPGSDHLDGGFRGALPGYLGDLSADPQANARCRVRARVGHRLDSSRVGDVVRQ